MKAEDAVKFVANYVRESGTPASDATRKLWKDLDPPEVPADWREMLQFAVACRVSTDYRTPFYEPGDEKLGYGKGGNGHTTVAVRYHKSPRKEYAVSVSILQDLRWNVNGKVKPVAVMTRHDILTLKEQFQRFEDGYTRIRRVMEYIANRMATLKKDKVEDLADGEQQKIARMLHDIKSQRFPKDLPDLKGLSS